MCKECGNKERFCGTDTPGNSADLSNSAAMPGMGCKSCDKHADKLNKISTVVNSALLTTTMRKNARPEVFISGSRFIEAKSLEDVLGHIAELLVA